MPKSNFGNRNTGELAEECCFYTLEKVEISTYFVTKY